MLVNQVESGTFHEATPGIVIKGDEEASRQGVMLWSYLDRTGFRNIGYDPAWKAKG
jgi:hypothetical protein